MCWFPRFLRDPTMGNLLKVLTCTDLDPEPNFFLDFESKTHTVPLVPLVPLLPLTCCLPHMHMQHTTSPEGGC